MLLPSAAWLIDMLNLALAALLKQHLFSEHLCPHNLSVTCVPVILTMVAWTPGLWLHFDICLLSGFLQVLDAKQLNAARETLCVYLQ